MVIILDVPTKVGFKRIAGRGKLDRLEQEKRSFHEKVRKGFLKLAKSAPRRFSVIDATQTRDEVAQEVRRAVEKRLVKR